MADRLPPMTPRPHQLEALAAMATSRANGVSKYFLDMAMATGKTMTSSERARDHLESDPNSEVLFLAHRTGIGQHALATFDRQLSPYDIQTGVLTAGEQPRDQRMTVGLFQMMTSRVNGGQSLFNTMPTDKYKLIIVDEGQHGPAPKWRPVIEHFQPEELLGMSGVPFRLDGLDINEVFGPTVYRKSLGDAFQDDLLTPAHYTVHAEKARTIAEIMELASTVTLEQLEGLLFKSWDDEAMVEQIGEDLTQMPDPYGIIYCRNVKHANEMARLIRKRLPQYSVAAIHHRQKGTTQKRNMARLLGGDLQLATAVSQLDEGIDIPHLNYIASTSTTRSFGTWLNRYGRILRLHPGKEMAYASDFTNSMYEIGMADKLKSAMQPTEPNAKRRKPRKLIPEVILSPGVKDIIAEEATIRRRLQARQLELSLPPGEVPLSIPTSLVTPEGTIPLHPVQGTILAYIYTNDLGMMQEKHLRAVCRKYFSQVPAAMGTMMATMAEAGLVSKLAWPSEGSQKVRHWRLTDKTIKAFLAIEPYKQARDAQLQQLQNYIAEEQARALTIGYQAGEQFSLQYRDGSATYTVTADQPAGYQIMPDTSYQLLQTDVTEAELATLRPVTPRESARRALYAVRTKEVIHVSASSVESITHVTSKDASGRYRRQLGHAQIAELLSELKLTEAIKYGRTPGPSPLRIVP